MALDEANALVTVMLEEETEPARRARLVALQLALGFPHALTVEPQHLGELRAAQRQVGVVRAQRLLAATSAVATVWSVGVLILLDAFATREGEVPLAVLAFVISALHGGLALANAWGAPSPAALRFVAWSWLVGPPLVLAVGFLVAPEAGAAAFFSAVPSWLVCMAASRVRRAAVG